MRGNAVNVGNDPRDTYFQGSMCDMACFDSLPKPLRKLIANAEYNYAAESLLENWLATKAKFEARMGYQELLDIFTKAIAQQYVKQRKTKTPFVIAMAPYKDIT